jgi:hypothetical protein
VDRTVIVEGKCGVDECAMVDCIKHACPAVDRRVLITERHCHHGEDQIQGAMPDLCREHDLVLLLSERFDGPLWEPCGSSERCRGCPIDIRAEGCRCHLIQIGFDTRKTIEAITKKIQES